FRLAGIAGATNQNQLLTEIHQDERPGIRAVGFRLGLQSWRVDDGEFRDMAARLLVPIGTYEHMARKQAMPGIFGDDADRNAEFRIGAREAILHVDLFAPQMRKDFVEHLIETAFERAIDLAPPDVFLRSALANNELIVRRTSRMLTGVNNKRTEMSNLTLITVDDVFIKLACAQVPI